MSFRLRVLVLTMFIAVTATATTAWLTLRQASRQLTETVTGSQQEIALVTEKLAAYGRAHGTWDGVAGTVRSLAESAGQRVRVVTESGTVLADSDILGGRAARPVAGPAALVDPRPVLELQLPTDLPLPNAVQLVWSAVYQYHVGLRYAACLTELGVSIRTTRGASGIPEYVAGDVDPATVDRCRIRSRTESQSLARTVVELRHGTTSGLPSQFRAAVKRCESVDTGQLAGCLQRAFTQQISDFAPQPLQVYLGARNDLPPKLSGKSTVLAAVVVAAVAVIAAWLLSRRVLRPISALTAASRRLGAGDRTERVPVAGRDELADLGQAFNRMADSLQGSEERQRRMVADVAHELRTPLANLRGYLEALKDGVLPPSTELFTSLHEEALLQQRIVDDLQDLALAEAGALAYHRAVIDLAELVETCRTAHGPLAEDAGISVAVDAAGPVSVHGDADRLRQVLSNLVRNAVAATPSGGTITLRVRLGRDAATIEVIDDGAGIAAADLPYVFDRFWRADSSRGRTCGGGGLGLAIARQMVTDHGGFMAVTSQLSRGTTFTITLPVTTDRDRAAVRRRGIG